MPFLVLPEPPQCFDPEVFSKTPWGAADRYNSHTPSGYLPWRSRRSSGLRLWMTRGDEICAADPPPMVTVPGLLDHLRARPVRDLPEARTDVYSVANYREAAVFERRSAQEPARRDAACLLWDCPGDVFDACFEVAFALWLEFMSKARSEPHASLLRAKQHFPTSRMIIFQGVLDALWAFGFPRLAESWSGPPFASLPSYVLMGFLPLGWDGSMFQRMVVYDAREGG